MSNEDRLLSVGIDIGTTTTHLVVTSLKFGNLARPTHIRQLGITDKEILFESAIYETPLCEDGRIDAVAVAQLMDRVYAEAALVANLDMSGVQTGAVIITGESARTRNAQAVLEQAAKLAGEFVVESAGPGLESILCARGSGAQAKSKEEGNTVLSLDIGGGTSNFALVEKGEIAATAAVSIGGRAIKFAQGKVSHLSDSCFLLCQANGINLTTGAAVGDCQGELTALADFMAGLIVDLCCPQHKLPKDIEEIWLTPAMTLEKSPEVVMISGGVAALMQNQQNDLNRHQDFGVYLARALNQTLRDRHVKFVLAANAIRATVLGAGMHTLQLTGSTIDFAYDSLPLRNLPLIKIDAADQTNLVANIKRSIALKEIDWSQQPVALALTGLDPNQLQYARVKQLATSLAQAQEQMGAADPLVVTVDQDIAMALGQLLKRLVPDKRIISVDGVVVHDGDYLDIGKPIYSNSLSDKGTGTLPVVVKTLIFYKN
jgi:ethanolamine utilization protein EutA